MTVEIYFQAYHEGELWDKSNLEIDGVRLEKIWDGYTDNLPLEDAKVPDEMVEAFYQSRVQMHSSRKVVPESLRTRVLRDAPPLEREADVYLLIVKDLKAFRTHLRTRWADHLLEAENLRGADDGTYDYYPDLWFISHQLFNTLGMAEEYNRLRKQLFDTTAYGDPDGDLMEMIPAAEE